jgi:transposase
MGGHRPLALTDERDRILERVAQQPDLPSRAGLAELQSRGIGVSYFAVCKINDHAGFSVKKTCTPANRTARTSPAAACNGNKGRAKRSKTPVLIV